jgi:hypothetical protein
VVLNSLAKVNQNEVITFERLKISLKSCMGPLGLGQRPGKSLRLVSKTNPLWFFFSMGRCFRLKHAECCGEPGHWPASLFVWPDSGGFGGAIALEEGGGSGSRARAFDCARGGSTTAVPPNPLSPPLTATSSRYFICLREFLMSMLQPWGPKGLP